MKPFLLSLTALLLVPLAALHAADTMTIPVDSPAFAFSPGNWTGDEGRAGKTFRQTWNPGAYFRVTWETRNPKPAAKILLYCINACGWSGWINKGDNPPGDVPGYYVIANSSNGTGGQYDDAASRWNKIDGNCHSLLDSRGHISAYGQVGQEPSLIMVNYGTNDALHKSNPSDAKASIIQSLAALRQSAPAVQIIVLIPFGQYYAKE